MRPNVLAVLLALALPSLALAQTPKQPAALSSVVQKAVNDPARAADRDIDARRKVGQVMMFAEVKPGQKVLELLPGSGYFTRVFSAIVGPSGHVYTVWPYPGTSKPAEPGKRFTAFQAIAAEPHYANISSLQQPAAVLTAPVPVDLVFTSQNYHDYLNPSMGPVDMVKFDREVFAALKPGGLFVIIDHVAPAGSGASDTNTLHRVDPAFVKKQVEEAGFVFDGESNALRNAKDPHDIKVFDKSIRGHTDQFMYRFRKPAQ